MGVNYNILRNRFNDTIVKKGIHLSVADKVTDDVLIMVEDMVWDGADRWAFKAFRDGWIKKEEWKDRDKLTASLVTHILTYWNEEIGVSDNDPTLELITAALARN